jgi:hypothetical protein
LKGKQNSGVREHVMIHSNAETSCHQRNELSPPHIDASVPPMRENCFLRMCHHIVIELYIAMRNDLNVIRLNL